MNAKQLREEGKLWPQTLTDEELHQEFYSCDPRKCPVSYRMLSEESQARAHSNSAARHNCIEYDTLAECLGITVDAPGWLVEARKRIGFDRPSGPRRTASVRCESGKRNYCTCDTCF